jgi:hypothetical protein
MRKADTIFLFDPRVHMNLSEQDLKNLEDFEKLDKLPWFKEFCKLRQG